MNDSSSRMLIIGEDDDLMATLRSQLENDGYSVLEASNTTAVIDTIGTARVDLILADLGEPGSDRLDLLTVLTNRLPDVPVIVISASSSDNRGTEALHRGAFDHLSQPLLREQVLTIVHQALELHRLRAENRILRNRISEGYLTTWHKDHHDSAMQVGIQDLKTAEQDPSDTVHDDPAMLSSKFIESGLALSEVERRLIIASLERNDGNQTQAARTLGLTRNTLIYRMKKHGIGPKRVRSTRG